MFGLDDLGLASLGLGAAGDIFGAYSQQQAASRQRDLYNQYQNQMQQMQNPAYILSQAQPYYQADLASLKKAIPDIMRSTVNPMLGGQGLDPKGGIGTELTMQALAPYYQQAWTGALNQVGNQNQMALNALGGAGQNIGQPSGQMGGTANALQSLMLYQAMNRKQPTVQNQDPGMNLTDFGGSETGTTNPYSLNLGTGNLSQGAVFGNPSYMGGY